MTCPAAGRKLGTTGAGIETQNTVEGSHLADDTLDRRPTTAELSGAIKSVRSRHIDYHHALREDKPAEITKTDASEIGIILRMTDTEKIFGEAIAALNAHDVVTAETLFKKVLQADQNHIPALNLLTVVLMSRGRFAEAEEFIERATRLNRTSDVSFYNYGLISKHLGKPQQALDNFNKAIALNPAVPETWNNRGTVFSDQEKHDLALRDFDKAISLNDRYAEGYANKGKSLAFLGRREEAFGAYEKALSLRPDLAEAWLGCGNVLRAFKRHDEASVAYDRALSLKPDLAEAWLGRGNMFSGLKRHDEAFAAYDKALSLKPYLAEAWLGRGNVFSDLKRHDEAFAAYDKALSLKPALAEAWLGHGNLLNDLKRHDEAFVAFDKALSLEPDMAGAWLGRGNAFSELKYREGAFAAYDKALSLEPDLAEAWLGRGNVFRELKRHDEGFAAYDKALSLNPALAEAWLGRGNVFSDLKRQGEAFTAYDKALSLKPGLAEAWLGRGNMFSELKDYDEAFVAYDKATSLKPDLVGAEGFRLGSKMLVCSWANFETERDHLVQSIRNGKENSGPFSFLGVSSSPEDQLKCAQMWARKLYPRAKKSLWFGELYQHSKVRVAYVSADFRQQPQADLLVGVFEGHDRSQFEVLGISIGLNDNSEIRRRLERSFDRFLDASDLDDDALTKWIRQEEIDLLIDMGGFTQHARTEIFARRPAPIQVNYLGYPGTMGADYIDYIIADPVLIPASHRDGYSEKIVYLPHSYLPHDDKSRRISDRPMERAEFGLPADGFVFCCFNNAFKFNPDNFRVRMNLLRAVEGSVLWLSENNPTAVKNLRAEAAAAGVDPGRLVFARRLPSAADHLARHRLADLFLDTLPFNAHTTASDALWAGLPVLTQTGKTFAGRVAGSLLNAIHMTELIAETPEEFERQAIDLAMHPEKLKAIKLKLEKNRLATPLFKTSLYTRHIEAAYVAMFDRQQAGLAPEHIFVPE